MSPSHTPDTVQGTEARDCSVMRQVLDRVGEKWSLLAVLALRDGVQRFNPLRRRLGSISPRILTRTLRALERDGLVSRTVYPTVPPQVEYALTGLGQSLLGPADALLDWAQRHREAMDRARQQFDTLLENAGG